MGTRLASYLKDKQGRFNQYVHILFGYQSCICVISLPILSDRTITVLHACMHVYAYMHISLLKINSYFDNGSVKNFPVAKNELEVTQKLFE